MNTCCKIEDSYKIMQAFILGECGIFADWVITVVSTLPLIEFTQIKQKRRSYVLNREEKEKFHDYCG
jgi:hypothetical protein